MLTGLETTRVHDSRCSSICAKALTQATQTAAWTVDTVPTVVKAMILKQDAYLWQFRGDEAKGEDDDGLAPGVRQLSWFYRDPVVA